MKRSTEQKLRAFLTIAIEQWLDEGIPESLRDDMPWLGDNIGEIMASAALAVLLGIADTEAYIKANDLLKDE